MFIILLEWSIMQLVKQKGCYRNYEKEMAKIHHALSIRWNLGDYLVLYLRYHTVLKPNFDRIESGGANGNVRFRIRGNHRNTEVGG